MSTIAIREPLSPTERRHATECPCVEGKIDTVNGQDTVRCSACNTFLYNAPKTETGRAVRTVTTVHNGIKPKQRARVIMRDGGRCFLCGATENLHVGHCVSVDEGLKLGLTEADLNDDENLVCQCAECNLGMGSEPMPVRFVMRALMVRLRARRAQ